MIGHCSRILPRIAGMDASSIADFVCTNKIIDKVVLFGCNTVSTKRLEEEDLLIDSIKYQNTLNSYSHKKQFEPFARSMELKSHERNKLLDSLLTQVIDQVEIKLKENERHDSITIEGYPNRIYVDTMKGKFHVVPTDKSYKKAYKLPFFATKIDNLNRVKLLESKDAHLREIIEGNSSTLPTLAKKIRVKVPFKP
jgi:hypothetical protein